MMGLRVLVTGGRDYFRFYIVDQVLDRIHNVNGISLIIQGGANGADRMARGWAIRRNVPFHTEYAYWNRYRAEAGPIRNQVMIDMRPDLVVAFPGGPGTNDCVRKAKRAKIEIVKVVK